MLGEAEGYPPTPRHQRAIVPFPRERCTGSNMCKEPNCAQRRQVSLDGPPTMPYRPAFGRSGRISASSIITFDRACAEQSDARPLGVGRTGVLVGPAD